jgi:hypothetical protein
VVDPLRIVATVQCINDPTIVQVKVESVVRLGRVVRVAANGFGHADALTHVLNDPFTSGHVACGKHAFAMHTRRQDLDGTGRW